MRILFVTPYPLSHIRVRSYGFVKELSKHHEVWILTLCSNQRERTDVDALRQEGLKVVAIYDSRWHKLLRCISKYGTTQPLQVTFDAAPELRALLQSYIASHAFDLLHIEFIRALGMLPALPDALSIPCVWDAVDCVSQLYEQGAMHGATLLMRLLGQHEAQRVRAYERNALYHFRHVLVTSERERDSLLQIAAQTATAALKSGVCAKISVVPHGIDQNYFQPFNGPRQPGTLVFSGKMSFHANIAGVLQLAKHILPLIWQRQPDVRLVIVGSDPPLSVLRLACDPRIVVTGYVPDLRSFVARAWVAVCPLPYAVGIQNKVLEAMALGTPVVASSHAAAGLQTTGERNLLIADTPQDFANAVVSLMTEPTLWQQLSQQGQEYIQRYHHWDTILTRLQAVYVAAIADAQANTHIIQEAGVS